MEMMIIIIIIIMGVMVLMMMMMMRRCNLPRCHSSFEDWEQTIWQMFSVVVQHHKAGAGRGQMEVAFLFLFAKNIYCFSFFIFMLFHKASWRDIRRVFDLNDWLLYCFCLFSSFSVWSVFKLRKNLTRSDRWTMRICWCIFFCLLTKAITKPRSRCLLW